MWIGVGVWFCFFFFFQAEDGIRDHCVTGVQTCALPISKFTEVLGGNGAVNFAEPPAGVTDIEAGAILVFDVPFPHAGAYRFEITIDGDRKASVPLTVSQLPAPPKGGSN